MVVSRAYRCSPGAPYDAEGFGYLGTNAADLQDTVVAPVFAGHPPAKAGPESAWERLVAAGRVPLALMLRMGGTGRVR
jgi:hypothetical protein